MKTSLEMAPRQLVVDDEVTLQRTQVTDADEYYDLVSTNRDYLHRSGEHTIADHTPYTIAKELTKGDRHMSAGAALDYWIVGRGRRAGAVGLQLLGAVGEINYWLAEDRQGNGLATRASAHLIGHAFATQPQLETIQLAILQNNQASARVAERLGARWTALIVAGEPGQKRAYDLWRVDRHEW